MHLFIIHGALATSCPTTKKAVNTYQQWLQKRRAAKVHHFYTGSIRGEDETSLSQWLPAMRAEAAAAGVTGPIPCFVFGGDGTLNLLVQEIHRGDYHEEFLLIPIPLGTGNDAARRFKIKTWRWLLDAGDAVTSLDLHYGQINDRVFINSTGIGLSADLVAAQSLQVKRYFGKLSYTLAALAWLLNPRSQHITIDGEHADVMLLSIAVGQYCGGGINLHPNAAQAVLQQQLSVVGISKVPRYLHPWYLIQVLRGQHLKCKHVTEIFTPRLVLRQRSSLPIKIEVDGDLLTQIVGGAPTEVRLSEHAIAIYVPAI